MRICLNCVYVCCDPCEWLRCHMRGEPLVPPVREPSPVARPVAGGLRHALPELPAQAAPPDDTARRIPLGDGQYAIVDAADYEWLSRYHWHLKDGYAMRNENHQKICMHRQIMRPRQEMLVDHINHNRGDNRRGLLGPALN